MLFYIKVVLDSSKHKVLD